MISAIHHDMNNKLFVILGHAEMLNTDTNGAFVGLKEIILAALDAKNINAKLKEVILCQ